MLLTVKDLPFEIDTAFENGKRWAHVWITDFCILDDAICLVGEITERGNHEKVVFMRRTGR